MRQGLSCVDKGVKSYFKSSLHEISYLQRGSHQITHSTFWMCRLIAAATYCSISQTVAYDHAAGAIAMVHLSYKMFHFPVRR